MEATTVASSVSVPLKATVCSIGGCIGSPEDKIAVMAVESLFILNPHLTFADQNASKVVDLHRVHVKQRFRVAVDLENSVIHKGTKHWNESKVAFAEHANRCVIYPGEEVFRDAAQERTGVRCIDWSPRGMDRFGRCVMAVVTLDGKAAFYGPHGANQWHELVDFSQAWQSYYTKNGRVFKSCEHTFDDKPKFDPECVKDVYENILNCSDVASYIDALEDINLRSASWGQLIRRPQVGSPKPDAKSPKPTTVNHINVLGSKLAHPFAMLVFLSKSGAISFWRVTTPLVGLSSIFLVRVDYTYAISRTSDSVSASNRAVFIKFCDLDASTGMLVVGLANGAVYGQIYNFQFAMDGSFSLKMLEKLTLCKHPTPSIPIVACAWCFSSGRLCLGYGRHLLIACVKVLAADHTLHVIRFDNRGPALPTYHVESSVLCKPPSVIGQITGVQIDNDKVYITTLDGYLICKDLKHTNPTEPDWKILWSSSCCSSPKEVRWEFHGLSISTNGVFIIFLEQPVNYLDCARQLKRAQFLPTVRFLSIWTDSKLIDLVFDTKLPLHRKSDGLLALAQRWLRTSDAPSTLREQCVTRLQFSTDSDSLPDEWLNQPLSMLHLYRFLLTLFVGDAQNPEIGDHASRWLILVDRLIHQRHWDRCFRSFLESRIQRQASDCLLVVRMTTLLMEFWKHSSSVGDNQPIPYKCFIPTLPKTTEQASQLARQLYVHRFKLPAEDLPVEPQRCAVCSEKLIPNIEYSKCSKLHPIPRCMQTLEPCIGVAFRRCDRCGRVAVSISPQDRPSVWRMSVVHSMCIFCDAILVWEDL